MTNNELDKIVRRANKVTKIGNELKQIMEYYSAQLKEIVFCIDGYEYCITDKGSVRRAKISKITDGIATYKPQESHGFKLKEFTNTPKTLE
jgi:hypothetical protein